MLRKFKDQLVKLGDRDEAMTEYGNIQVSQTVTPRHRTKNTMEMDNYYRSVRDYKR
jgi:hypothetical protein